MQHPQTGAITCHMLDAATHKHHWSATSRQAASAIAKLKRREDRKALQRAGREA